MAIAACSSSSSVAPDAGPSASPDASTPAAEGTDSGGAEAAASSEAAALEASADSGLTCGDGGVQSWDPQPVRADKNNPEGGSGARVGWDAAGNAIAVWEQAPTQGAVTSVWASQRSPGGTWSNPQQIGMTLVVAGSATGTQPALAVSAGGSAVAVWQQYAGGNPTAVQHVWASRYAPGSGWSTEMAIEAPVAATDAGVAAGVLSSDPQVAIDSKGNAVAAWSENDGQIIGAPDFSTQIYANRYTPGTGWSGPTRLSSFGVPFMGPSQGSEESGSADVAVDESGDAVVAWYTDVSNVGYKVQAARYDGAAATWSSASYLDTCVAPSCASDMAPNPRVALDLNRNAIVVWQQATASADLTRPWAARFTASSTSWAAPQQLDTNLTSTSAADHARVSVDPSGNAIAVWHQNGPTNNIIGAYFTGGAWKPAQPLDVAHPGGYNTEPTVVLDDAGNGFVVWDNQGDTFAARFTSATATFSPETQISPGNGASDPDIAISPGSCPAALAVWTGQDPTGANGVYTVAYH
jgi:hypothetical protein